MNWKVRYIDYPAHYGSMREEVLAVIDDTLSRGDLMLRQQLADFENGLAEFVGTSHAVGVGNCTDGMLLALVAAGVGPGDEVITVSHTMVATVAAIHHAGAIPVLVDIGDDHTMDVAAAAAAITSKTRAVIPVQVNGRLVDMDELVGLARARGLLIIEDSAQALGATMNGVGAGTFGLAGCFSFYPAKLLGAFGDAGGVVTNDPEFAERIRLLRNHGRLPDGDVMGWAYNSRMDNLHAAILSLKLRRLAGWIDRRRKIAAMYQERLADLPELLLPPPPVDEGPRYDVFQNYEIEADRRDELRAHLTGDGVETLLPWGGRGVHQLTGLGLGDISLPRTERMFERCLMIPMYPELADDKVEYVADSIRRFYSQ